jgi:hypothetical protein
MNVSIYTSTLDVIVNTYTLVSFVKKMLRCVMGMIHKTENKTLLLQEINVSH